jgi:hypothetical protein
MTLRIMGNSFDLSCLGHQLDDALNLACAVARLRHDEKWMRMPAAGWQKHRGLIACPFFTFSNAY